MLKEEDLLRQVESQKAAEELQRGGASKSMLGEASTRIGVAQLQRKLVQRRARQAAEPDTATIQKAAEQGIQGAAEPLPHLDTIQRSFGSFDVSGTRSHTDGAASEANRAMNAEGYAADGEVAFRGRPSLFTAAHEAAHVVQQRGGVQFSDGIGQEGDAFEQHADQVAQAVVDGRSAESLLARQAAGGTGHAVQRQLAPQQDDAQPLTPAQAQSAVSFNRGLRLPSGIWEQVASVVGSPETSVGKPLVQVIAAWQRAKGLTADGKCGDITFQWMSEDPAGQGLDTQVKKETTLFMGLNPEAKGVEYSTLKSQTGAASLVNASGDDRHQDQVKAGGQWASLDEGTGLDRALSLLPNLPREKADEIIRFLSTAADKTKDEMFNMIQHLWAVQTGKAVLKRLVLSGHSSGGSLWGGHEAEYGIMSYSQIYQLFSLFPRAAGQVEDLAFSACFSGMQGNMGKYREVFPNLKTIWGYAHFSPSAATGSTRHLSQWEKGTRGHQAAGANQARERVARGSGPRDQNVAIWSIEDGYQTNVGGAQMSTQTLRASIQGHQADYDVAMSDGTINMSALNDLYASLQSLVRGHGDELGDELQHFQTMLMQVLFLRNWASITGEFAAVHGAAAKAGYDEAGSTMPRWVGMSRAEVISAYQSFTPTGTKGQRAKQLMKSILIDLDPSKISYGGGNA